MALLKVCKIGSLMARTGSSFSPRLMATFPTKPLMASADKKTKETLENIKAASSEVKKTVQDMRKKVNNAADEVIVKAVKAASRALDAKKDEKPKDSAKETLQKNKDSVLDKANDTKNFALDEINKMKNSTEEKFEETKENVSDKIEKMKDSAEEKYQESKERIDGNVSDAKDSMSRKYEKMKGSAGKVVDETKAKIN